MNHLVLRFLVKGVGTVGQLGQLKLVSYKTQNIVLYLYN